MATMGKYCKAYQLKDLRRFSGWTEIPENARLEQAEQGKGNGDEIEMPRMLTDDSIVYIQENNVVTDGAYKDENIIFDQVTREWIDYCHNELGFEIPVYDDEPIEIKAEAEQDA